MLCLDITWEKTVHFALNKLARKQILGQLMLKTVVCI